MGMGIDPPKSGETHTVTIELKGPLTEEEFKEYQRQINKCIEKLQERWRASRGAASLRIPPKWRRGTAESKRGRRKKK